MYPYGRPLDMWDGPALYKQREPENERGNKQLDDTVISCLEHRGLKVIKAGRAEVCMYMFPRKPK